MRFLQCHAHRRRPPSPPPGPRPEPMLETPSIWRRTETCDLPRRARSSGAPRPADFADVLGAAVAPPPDHSWSLFKIWPGGATVEPIRPLCQGPRLSAATVQPVPRCGRCRTGSAAGWLCDGPELNWWHIREGSRAAAIRLQRQRASKQTGKMNAATTRRWPGRCRATGPATWYHQETLGSRPVAGTSWLYLAASRASPSSLVVLVSGWANFGRYWPRHCSRARRASVWACRVVRC